MRTLGVVLVLGAAAMLASCASPAVSPSVPAQAAARDDKFLPYTEVVTATHAIGQFPADHVRMHLVAHLDRTSGKATTHAILSVVYAQRPSRHYESARNERAALLPMRQLMQDGGWCRRQRGCAHAESYQVDIPESDLRQARSSGAGYPIKLFARAGAPVLFPIQKEQVGSLVAALDRGPPPAGTPVAQTR